MKINELTIVDGALPIVTKITGLPAYVFNPQGALEEVRTEHDAFMVPYYKVKRTDVVLWVDKMAKNPPNPLGHYEAVILTYADPLMGEPRYGGGFYRVAASSN